MSSESDGPGATITEQQQAQIIDHLPDATFAIDAGGRVIAWNQAMEELTGVKACEMLGRGDYAYAIPFYGTPQPMLINLVSGSEEELRQAQYTKVRRCGRVLEAEKTLALLRSGEAILLGKAVPLYGQAGEFLGAMESIRDVTDLRTAEKILREREARLDTIVYNSPIPLFVIGIDHKILCWSKALEEYSGIKSREIMGTDRHWQPFYENERPCIADILVDGTEEHFDRYYNEKYRRSKHTDGAFEIVAYVRKTGKWLHATAVAIRDEAGRTIGAIEIFEDVTDLKKAEARIQASLQEKEAMLREIHHRVKNNLQIVSSMLNLQSLSITDQGTREIFRESQTRVRSMALIHEKLYRSEDFARINMAEYLSGLAASLYMSYTTAPGQIELQTDLEEIFFGVDVAIPCGLIVNELITNSLKYAFPGGRSGTIRVGLRSGRDGRVCIQISDDGVGLPEGLDIGDPPTLGLQLVQALIQQLDGLLEVDSAAGVTFAFSFQLPQPGTAGFSRKEP